MSEGLVGGGVSAITDLRALRTRILGKARVSKPVTNAETLIETLKGADFCEQVKLAVPAGVDFEVSRFVQSVMRALEEDERLLACEPKSVLGAALRCAEIGLMVGGVMQHAFMVPRARRDGRGGFMYEAELTIGYRGMIALAMRSGKVKSVTSRLVTDREIEEGRFDLYYEGDKDVMIHRPVLYGEKGEPVMVYCLVRFVDGTFHVEPMGKEEIEKIKEQAVLRWNGADGESPWVTNEMEMWRKSPVRRAFKYLNVQVEGLDRAVSLEEERERGQRQDLARLIDATIVGDEPQGDAGAAKDAPAIKVEDEPMAVSHTGSDSGRGEANVAAVSQDQGKGAADAREPQQQPADSGGTSAVDKAASGKVDQHQVEEVEGFKAAAEAISAISRKVSVERPAKYVDPKTGVTWNGWGKAPHWIPRDKTEREAFLIGAPKSETGNGAAAQGVVSEVVEQDGRVEGAPAQVEAAGAVVPDARGEGEPAQAQSAPKVEAESVAMGLGVSDGASAGDVEVTVTQDGQVQQPETSIEGSGGDLVTVGSESAGGEGTVAHQGDRVSEGGEETVELSPAAAVGEAVGAVDAS